MSFLPKRTIVAPVDFSDESFQALDVALTMVEGPEHVETIYVLPALEPTEPGVIWAQIDDESRRHHALLALNERLTDRRYQGLRKTIAFGDPGREIAEFAERCGAELIVLPSHGRTGLRRLLIGSVAERVVRLAHCPVLVLKRAP